MSLTKDEAQGVARLFIRDYPGALELAYKFRENTAELYGPRAGEVPQGMKGGYIPKETAHAGRMYRGRVEVPLENMTDARDLLLTLRHEVLGHYGANTFKPGEKRALLDGLIAAREEPSLKPLWADIDQRYAGSSLDMRAEEVFALHCEGVAPSQHVGNEQAQRGQQAFKETCAAPVRLMRADDLQSIACMVAQGLHDRTRTQQNFPALDTLFRKKETDMEPKKPFHETVAEKLIERLKEGTAPWQKPWQAGDPGAVMPTNPTTGKRYKGINAIHLMSQGHTDQRWMTYKQAAAVDAQVRKGEKGTPIQYWKFSEEHDKLDANGKPVLDAKGEPIKQTVKLERPRVFFATVFNAEQIDGLPALQPRKQQDWNAVERAEQILQASGAVIRHGEQNRAFYRPATDSIHLPDKGQFPTADNYYATALHELGHWTGHESRLDRDLVHPFGSEGYAKEELRAEIASMILGDELGIGHDPGQHVAYVGSWIKALEEDPLEIFRAAADAEKIQDYVLGLEQKQVQEQSTQQDKADELGQVLAELQELHQSAYEGYSPLESWKNLKTAAQENGLAASIGRGGAGEYAPPYVVTYADQAGQKTPISTELYNDGKAVTSVSGQRVPGTGLTSDLEWQSAALNNAVAQVRSQAPTQGADMKQPSIDDIPGRLVDRLTNSGAMSRSDAEVTSALRDFKTGTDATRQVDTQTLSEVAIKAFGAALPPDFTGQVQVVGVIERDGQAMRADEAGEQPEAFQVYARNGAAQFGEDAYALVATQPTEAAAQELADRLALIDAHSQTNEHDKAAKLARVNEEQVRRNPNSTAEDISAAKDARKDAEFTATQNDEDLQRRIAELEREQQQAAPAESQAVQQTPNASLGVKTLIDVPFKQKEEAKALGAKWDRQEQSWYVPANVDAAPFAKWMPGDATAAVDAPKPPQATQTPAESQKPSQERQYLAVPYGEHVAAKAAGAMWDKAAKSWYAGPKADMAKLERWAADKVPGQQGPAMTPAEEFAEALRSLGCVVDGKHPVMDGAKHRITVEGDKKGEQAGFYVGHLDGHPAGYIKNNKTGIDMKWKSKGYALDPEQKAQMQAEAAAKLQAREAEQNKLQEQTAQRVGRQMSDLVPVTQPTAYMQAKGIQPQAGVMTDRDGQKTYIPATDANGKQWTMQYIQEDGTKRFAKDSRKEGCFHAVGGLDALAKAPALVIGEGYATAGSLSQSLGFATVAAFDSGNLVHVAKALHEKFPDKPIIIAGDDDKHLEATQGVNPGRSKAEEAAKAVGGKVLLPIFAPGEQAANPKGFTDFNDLANKSELGKEGIERQVNSIVDSVIEKHQARIEQQQERVQQQQERPRRTAKIG
jgi:putative DNA primase/helicase